VNETQPAWPCWLLLLLLLLLLLQGIGTYLQDRTRPQGPNQPALFTPGTATLLEQSPGVIHFTGTPNITPSQLLNPYVRPPSKPWAAVCVNPYKDEWYRVLDQTPWRCWKPAQSVLAQSAVMELLGLCRQLQQGAPEGERECDGGSLRDAVCCEGGIDSKAFLQELATLCLAAAHDL
jgi:hypothetical protein